MCEQASITGLDLETRAAEAETASQGVIQSSSGEHAAVLTLHNAMQKTRVHHT